MNRNLNYKRDLYKGVETQKLQHEQRIKEYDRNPNKCFFCGEPLTYKARHNKCCSRSCSVKLNNKKRKKLKYCKNCSREIKSGNIFCGTKCTNEYKVKRRWEEFEKEGDFKKAHHTTIRKYLIHKHGNKCSICKIEKWGNKEIVFIVDHIDGDSTNTKINNCRLICPNCDSQLPTFKGKNAGKGRFNRRQRYKENKSF